MITFVIIFLCIIGIVAEVRLQKGAGLLTLFCGMWIFIISLAKMRLFDMVEVSDKIYTELLVGIVSFILAFICARFGRTNRSFVWNGKTRSKNSYAFNLSVIYVIEIITLIGCGYVASQCIVALKSGLSLEQFHNIYLNRGTYSIFPSRLFELYIKRVCAANVLFLSPLAIVMIFERKRKYVKTIILAILAIVLNQLATGGRMNLIYMVADILIAMSIYEFSLPKKWKKRIFKATILLLLCIIVITILRKNILENGKWELLYENTYIYFALCIPLADYWLNWIDLNGYLTLGVGTLSGVINLTNIFYSTIFGTNLPGTETILNVFNPVESNYIYVFQNAKCNAYVTWIFHLYADFREFGVIIGSLIFGLVCGKLARKCYYDSNICNIAMFLLLTQAVVKTFVRFEFVTETYILAFIFLRLCFRREKHNLHHTLLEV